MEGTGTVREGGGSERDGDAEDVGDEMLAFDTARGGFDNRTEGV